jgi:uncharacterized membrane protein
VSWVAFRGAFAAFFLTHALPLRPGPRARLTQELGPRGFGLLYSAVSLLALAWLVVAAGRALHVALWPWAPWQNHVSLAVKLAACLLAALAIGRPNPFSFGGGRDGAFDPARSGFVRWTRHPLLVALALWAGAHLPSNGELAHAILFGAFAAFALSGRRAIDRRRAGHAHAALWQAVTAGPLLPRPASAPRAAIRLGPGALAWLALVVAHPQVTGVSPLP